jgi:AcrR family transcriptional regulator
MAFVAREAGVGKATLSRRFATREELVTAVFADRMDAYASAVTEALADPDPWHGFIGYIHAVCAMQGADRGFADVLTMTFPAAKALEARRAEAYNGLLELIARAKRSGHLREDYVSEDLVILLMANARVIAAAGDAAPDTWRRLVGHMLRSYAAPGAPIPSLPEAPRPTALYRAMVRLSRTGHPPAADGTVVLDFNRAANLPCACTDLATCPLPPAENRLPVAIEAGLKIPRERGGA